MSTKSHPDDYFIKSGRREVKLLRKYFAIEGENDNVHTTREIQPDDVIHFYSDYLARVRPPKLSLNKILPKLSLSKLRGLYVGDPDANILLNFVVRHALYLDQILFVDPFTDPLDIRPDQNVLARPADWIEVIVNNALGLCALEEWIDEGIVLLIPKLLHYHPEIVLEYSKDTINSFLQLDPSVREGKFHRMILNLLISSLPEERKALIEVLNSTYGGNISGEEKETLLEEAQLFEGKNPIRFRLSKTQLAHYAKTNEGFGTVVAMGGGIPYHLAYPIAEETGSLIIFENKFEYDYFTKTVLNIDHDKNGSNEKLAVAFQELDFPFLNNVPLRKALDLRNKGYLNIFRSYLKELWTTIGSSESETDINNAISQYIDKLTSEYSILEMEWNDIRKEIRKKATTSGIKIGLSAVATGYINVGVGLAAISINVIKAIEDYNTFSNEINAIKRNPLAVFIELQDK